MAINTSKTVRSLTYNGTPLTLAPNISYGYANANDCCTASYSDGSFTITTTSTDFGVFKSGVNYSLYYYY